MAPNTLPRRELLKRAAAGTALIAVGQSLSTPAAAATTVPRLSAGAVVRSADIILKNGKIITVDASFTIAQAIVVRIRPQRVTT